MKHSENTRRPSTYQLLVQSEEKERNYFESLAYLLLIAATAASIWQFGHQLVTFTSIGVAASQSVTQQTTLRG
ncbi:MAG TPA: hypothetical protein VIL63_07820 [Terriglobales bacterium]|jgi:hypothetical protein